MESLTSRIPVLKQDCEIVSTDFLQPLKEIGSVIIKLATGEKSSKKLPLSYYARVSSLEKVNTVLKRSTVVLEGIVSNKEYSQNKDIISKLATDVDDVGSKLHNFCATNISKQKPAPIDDEVKPNENTSEDEDHDNDIQKEATECTDPSQSSEDKALISIDDEVMIRKRKTKVNFKRLNLIKTKNFSTKNERCSNKVKEETEKPMLAKPLVHKELAKQETTWITDNETVESYIQILYTHVEQLLHAMKQFTRALEIKRAKPSVSQRSYCTDSAGTFLRIIDLMDSGKNTSWQTNNSSQSNFKRSLSFRGRNASVVCGEACKDVSTTLIDSLAMQMPLRYKRSTGMMSM